MVRLITWNVARRVTAPAEQAAAVGVLCGDLNTPRREHPDGTVWSFARDGRGRLREERACAYHHERRPRVLSDHSALEAELVRRGGPGERRH